MPARRLLILGVPFAFVIVLAVEWLTTSPADAQSARVPDRFGDPEPLPEGAIVRLGSMRWLPRMDTVSEVRFSPDGRFLLALGSVLFGNVRPGVAVFDTATGFQVGPRELVDIDASGVARGPDSRRIVVAVESAPGEAGLAIWNLETGSNLPALEGSTGPFVGVDWSPDGRFIAAATPIDDSDPQVILWDAKSGSIVQLIDAAARRLAFSPESRFLASARDPHGEVAELALWQVPSGEEVDRVSLSKHAVWRINFSPDGKSIAAASETVVIWDRINNEVRFWDTDEEADLGTLDVQFHADGGSLAFIRAGDLEIHSLDGTQVEPKIESVNAVSMAYSADGRQLAFGRRRIELRDAATLERRTADAGPCAAILSLFPSNDGKRLRFLASDSTLYEWDVEEFREIKFNRLGGRWARADISADEQWIATAEDTPGPIKVRDASTLRTIFELPELESAIFSIEFVPNRNELISTEERGAIKVWDLDTREEVWNIDLGHPLLTRVRVSPDGSHCAVLSVQHDGAILYSLGARERVRLLRAPGGGVSVFDRLDFEADSSGVLLFENGSINRHDIASGEVTRLTPMLESLVTHLVADPTGNLFATVSHDDTETNRIQVWSYTADAPLLEFEAHEGIVGDIAFSPDGHRLYTSGNDTLVYAWDVSPAQLAATH